MRKLIDGGWSHAWLVITKNYLHKSPTVFRLGSTRRDHPVRKELFQFSAHCTVMAYEGSYRSENFLLFSASRTMVSMLAILSSKLAMRSINIEKLTKSQLDFT
jgi:hypothetical protein